MGEPGSATYAGHTAAFERIMDRLIGKGGDSGTPDRMANEPPAPALDDMIAITDDELVLMSRVAHTTRMVNIVAVKHSIDLELWRRSTSALVEFKMASATAASRLEILTKWLIVFTSAVVLLSVVIVVHDLTH